MHKYIPDTNKDVKKMLDFLQIDKVSNLFNDVPKELKLKKDLNLEDGKFELSVERKIKKIAKNNLSTEDLTCFLGAGAYDHFIPSVVNNLASRSEFYTSYTPYQAEISQGTLRAIYEYQSMIASLTGLDVSNASLYDGQTAAAEAALMAVTVSRKEKILVSKSVHPDTRKVLKTYLTSQDIQLKEVPINEGVTDFDKLKDLIDKDTAGVIIQSPNFFGIIEDIEKMTSLTKNKRTLFIQSTDPLSLGVLKSPGDLGVDIAIGDGQALGNSLNFGGPYLGFISTKKKYVRKLPGRIVGQTIDSEKNRAYTLTLQTREQHIRRERATSNICSNHGLNALMATIYLSTIGKKGLKEIGRQCILKANETYEKILEIDGFEPVFDKPFFKEFSIKSEISVEKINKKLLDNNILGGYDLGKDYKELKNTSLYCVTEKRTKKEIQNLVDCLEVM